jgi:hypothetical protein
MCSEVSTALRAVAADFFFTCWGLEIPSDSRNQHVPRCVHYHAQSFRLETFWKFYFGNNQNEIHLQNLSKLLHEANCFRLKFLRYGANWIHSSLSSDKHKETKRV